MWVSWKERYYLFLCVALKDAKMLNNGKGKPVVDSNIKESHTQIGLVLHEALSMVAPYTTCSFIDLSST